MQAQPLFGKLVTSATLPDYVRTALQTPEVSTVIQQLDEEGYDVLALSSPSFEGQGVDLFVSPQTDTETIKQKFDNETALSIRDPKQEDSYVFTLNPFDHSSYIREFIPKLLLLRQFTINSKKQLFQRTEQMFNSLFNDLDRL